MNNGLKEFLAFYLIAGLPGLIYTIKDHIKKNGYITLKDLLVCILLIIFSPFLTLGFLVLSIITLVEKTSEIFSEADSIILWRSKSNKAKKVLFDNDRIE